MLGAVPGHFDRLTPMAAAEIENRFVSNLIPDARTKQRFDLAAAFVTRRGFDVVPFISPQNCRRQAAAYKRHFLTFYRKSNIAG